MGSSVVLLYQSTISLTLTDTIQDIQHSPNYSWWFLILQLKTKTGINIHECTCVKKKLNYFLRTDRQTASDSQEQIEPLGLQDPNHRYHKWYWSPSCLTASWPHWTDTATVIAEEQTLSEWPGHLPPPHTAVTERMLKQYSDQHMSFDSPFQHWLSRHSVSNSTTTSHSDRLTQLYLLPRVTISAAFIASQ